MSAQLVDTHAMNMPIVSMRLEVFLALVDQDSLEMGYSVKAREMQAIVLRLDVI